MSQTTNILVALSNGDPQAGDRLIHLVYDELRVLAARFLRRERPDHTLSPTMLAHEAYLRLIDQSKVDWKNRAHFFAVASRLVRRILIDHARRHRALKRRPENEPQPLRDVTGGNGLSPIDLLALEEALCDLEKLNDRHRQIVEMRFFGGLTVDETAHVLGLSPQTVKSDWHMARAWLHVRLDG